MRGVIQRVSEASVSIDGKIFSEINRGILLLLGITDEDNDSDIDYIIDKILNLRIFPDSDDKMNKSLIDNNYSIMVVSQFTLYGDARKGRRPSFITAAKGDRALETYNRFVHKLISSYDPSKVRTGVFGSMMDIRLNNDGPVTILLDSAKQF